MKISFYYHVWQGMLMFLAGVICVLASFGGYLISGGGEQLLRRALLNVTRGKARYDSLVFDWREARIEVNNIRHEDFAWPRENPIARLSNLVAPKMFVQLEGWPLRVQSITLQGITGATVDVSEGFLQGGKLPDRQPLRDLPPIRFADCDLNLKLGETPPLKLAGFKGEMIRDAQGALRGGFSLKELNGKPFDFTMETLEDGRWIITGNTIHLDTQAVKAARNPFSAKIDPVGILVKALFSGEMGAQGTLNQLHITVRPATANQVFSCEGEVGYSDVALKLSGAEDEPNEALPLFMGMLLGADEKESASVWPRWMQVHTVITGHRGHVSFHMFDTRLEFNCDEGSGSAFTGIRGRLPLPAVESLKGSVETDENAHPRSILLRGFLGDLFAFETRMERKLDRARTYELLLEPRMGNFARVQFDHPLWRFQSHVTDYFGVSSRPSDLPLAEFEVEAAGERFPANEWLPPGLKVIGGRAYARGGLYNAIAPETGTLLKLNEARFSDGARITYGGSGPRTVNSESHPFWEAVYALFGTERSWSVFDLEMQGEATVHLDPDFQWRKLLLDRFGVTSGVLLARDALTPLSLPELRLSAVCERDTKTEKKDATITARGSDWEVSLEGHWVHAPGKPGSGEFVLKEHSVPLAIHPQREILSKTSAGASGRVSQQHTVHVTPDGVQVE